MPWQKAYEGGLQVAPDGDGVVDGEDGVLEAEWDGGKAGEDDDLESLRGPREQEVDGRHEGIRLY